MFFGDTSHSTNPDSPRCRAKPPRVGEAGGFSDRAFAEGFAQAGHIFPVIYHPDDCYCLVQLVADTQINYDNSPQRHKEHKEKEGIGTK